MVFKRFLFITLICCFAAGAGRAQPALRLLHQIRLPETGFYTFAQPRPDKLYLIMDTGLGLECREISDTTAVPVWRKAGLRLRYAMKFPKAKESYFIALNFNLGGDKLTLYLIEISSGIILDQLNVPIKTNQRMDLASYWEPYFLINLFSENTSVGLAKKNYLLFKIENNKIKAIDQFDFEATIQKFFIQDGILYGNNYAGCNKMLPQHGLPDCSPCFFTFSLLSHRVLNSFTVPETGFAASDFVLDDSVLYFKYSSNSYTPSPFSGLYALSFPALKPLYHKSLPFIFNIGRLRSANNLLFPIIDQMHDVVYFFNRHFDILKKFPLPAPMNDNRLPATNNFHFVTPYYLFAADFDGDHKDELLIYDVKKKLPLDPRAAYLTDENGETWVSMDIYYMDDDLTKIKPLISSLKLKGEKTSFFYFEHRLLLFSTYTITWFEIQ